MNAQQKRNHNFLKACGKMDMSMLKKMLAAGVDIETKNKEGKTALMIAATFGYASIVQLLMSLGANPFVQDHNGYTARDLAKAWKRQNVLAII